MLDEKPVVLCLFPNMRGIAYACIDSTERKIIESGVANVRPINNHRILYRIRKFVEFHNPTIIIVRDAKGTATKNGERLVELHMLIEHFAKTKNTPIYRYSRKQIKEVFEVFGAQTKEEIAKQLISWFDELKPFAPRIRKAWNDDDYHMGVFDAMALLITHQYLSK